MVNQLEQLKQFTTLVVDTGDIEAIKAILPQDATTNPSLIFQAAQLDKYHHLVEDAVKFAQKKGGSDKETLSLTLDQLTVNFGAEILKEIPGRVSTEVDARLSFDIEGSVQKARSLIAMYEAMKIPRERILIKLASTWEGIQACAQLEKEGIHCNMTLLFCLGQAIACAEARATLISPFVGRILDWYKKAEGKDFSAEEDPGVKSVKAIYNYFKKFHYKTQIMGASFRNVGEILELAGCDLLTIAPPLVKELSANNNPIKRKLDPEKAKLSNTSKLIMGQKEFRWALNEDPMATDKLAEGIRNFSKDLVKLEQYIMTRFLSESSKQRKPASQTI